MHNQSIGISALDYYLAPTALSNEALNMQNPSWDMDKATERSGVLSRPIAPEGITALDLAYQAVKNLLQANPEVLVGIDGLIFCTQTPDYLLPSNSNLLHGLLDLPSHVMAFDINHACSGYPYAIGIAKSLVTAGMATRVLVITADTYSRLIHPLDRSVRPLFGDAASASVISNSDSLTIDDQSFGTTGKLASRFIVENGGMRHSQKNVSEVHLDSSLRVRSPDHIQMDGMGVLSFFNKVVPVSIKEILVRNKLDIQDVTYFVLHQASQLALDSLRKSLGVPSEKVIIDMSDTGNLVSSSIPVVLKRAVNRGLLKKGDRIILGGFGVGLSWGTVLATV
jgi:3-oxoacyl-[acyl-carrier-protein] synthase-3